MELIAEMDEDVEEASSPDVQDDKGGGVYPSQICPHIFSSPIKPLLDGCVCCLKAQLRAPFFASCRTCSSDSGSVENWICLACLHTGCSRYVNSHGEEHFLQGLFAQPAGELHPLALSRSDLSVWCYACSSYVTHERLIPLLRAAEQLKFPEHPKREDLASRRFPVGFATQPLAVHGAHAHPAGANRCYERPARVASTLQHLENKALLKQLCTVPVDPALGGATALLRLVHTQAHIDAVRANALPPQGDLYTTPDTAAAAEAAVESLVSLVAAVCRGTHGLSAGFALLRPPGHHAEADCAGGFCFFNSVAVAARWASEHRFREAELRVSREEQGSKVIEREGMKSAPRREDYPFKVAVVDWDIHHGNGAQSIFYSDSGVLTVSIHKHRGVLESVAGEPPGAHETHFAPAGLEDRLGEGAGRGFNINIPLGSAPCGDADYLHVFDCIVQPVLAAFKPDLILVAAGFDAGVGDGPLPVGGYAVTPAGFAEMTRRLLQACPRVVASLEGGYDIAGLAASCEAVVGAMLEGRRAGLVVGRGAVTAAAAVDAAARSGASASSAVDAGRGMQLGARDVAGGGKGAEPGLGPRPETLEAVARVAAALRELWPGVRA